jgi:hypothetical protein
MGSGTSASRGAGDPANRQFAFLELIKLAVIGTGDLRSKATYKILHSQSIEIIGMSRLKIECTMSMAQRAIATLHSFRFFGLVFLLPGVIGPDLPTGFATSAAYGDLATGGLAVLELFTVRERPLLWLFAAAFNVVGVGMPSVGKLVPLPSFTPAKRPGHK